MPKTLISSCKICRREGVSLCGREKCAFKKRPYPPGVHGPKQVRRSKLSGYGVQLREKQKAKRLYNLMEKQFRTYFEKASNSPDDTGQMMIQRLERRLDNVIYRFGFASTRRQARQMVSHGFIQINGKKVNIPSYIVSVGEEIAIRESKKKKALLKETQERLKQHQTPGWLTIDEVALSGKVTSLPEKDDLKTIFDPKLIVEFYSR